MKHIKLAIKITAGFIFAAIILFLVSPAMRHQIHWVRYGYDRVWYHNRTYVNPHEYSSQKAENKFWPGQKIVATGEKVIGLPVYDTIYSLTIQQQRNVVPTLLFLKKPNGDFVVYELSGGP